MNKWNDPWFRRLTPDQKLFWMYVCDTCDNAGVWKIDFELASFQIGIKVTEDFIKDINEGKERVIIKNDLLLIRDFVVFQIGDITSKKQTNLQKNCVVLIEKYVKTGVFNNKDFYPELTGKLPVGNGYKYKGIGKGIGKGKVKDKEDIKDKYLEFVYLTKDDFNKLIEQFGTNGTRERIKTMNSYAHQIGQGKFAKYKSHYHTLLNWARKDEKKVVDSGRPKAERGKYEKL